MRIWESRSGRLSPASSTTAGDRHCPRDDPAAVTVAVRPHKKLGAKTAIPPVLTINSRVGLSFPREVLYFRSWQSDVAPRTEEQEATLLLKCCGYYQLLHQHGTTDPTLHIDIAAYMSRIMRIVGPTRAMLSRGIGHSICTTASPYVYVKEETLSTSPPSVGREATCRVGHSQGHRQGLPEELRQ